MNILILGSGGREHAFAWKIADSPKIEQVFIAPGNAGTKSLGTNIPIDINDFEGIKKAVIENDIDMVIVGPEVPLVKGIHDYFLADKLLKNIAVIGPVKNAAMLEGSKDFAKAFMIRNDIPTARYKTFDSSTLNAGISFLEKLNPPYVLKADGLAAGKGVLIINNLADAKTEFQNMVGGEKFGEASSKVVIEEFLSGIELSFFVLTDGNSYIILPAAKDYKRIGEGDTGLNTGGMGSVSPVSFADINFKQNIEDKVIRPTIRGLRDEGINYKGFIFFGLINVDNEPYVIEYNCRMGDPEAEVVIPRIKSDLVDLLEHVANNTLHEATIEFDPRVAVSVMLVSKGYPEKYEKGKTIHGIGNAKNCVLFHAGTSTDIESNDIKTSGGRVIAITAFGTDMEAALQEAYENAEVIDFEGKYYRKDIGFDLKK
jgi:phosphoribosylamine---glycine ligase